LNAGAFIAVRMTAFQRPSCFLRAITNEMAIHEDLIYFLKNGRLENINFGITKEEFIEILGEPEFENPPVSSIIRFEYDDHFEFYFQQETWKQEKAERLVCIIYKPSGQSKSSVLQFNSYNWTADLSLEDGLKFLVEHDIKFEEKPYFDEEYRVFETEGKVTIDFDSHEQNGNFTFWKISREIQLSPFKPPTRQISFEIEEIYYEQLRKSAEKTRISIASQCREIIENHLENK
jgi:hypothetical protein